MNKRKVITKEVLDDLERWLEKNIEWLKYNNGCAHYRLDNHFEIAIGWCEGYDPEDEDCIHDINSPEWCLNVGVKCVSEYAETDYEELNSPYDIVTGEVWPSDITLQPKEDNRKLARWLLEEWVDMVNESKKKNTNLWIY